MLTLTVLTEAPTKIQQKTMVGNPTSSQMADLY